MNSGFRLAVVLGGGVLVWLLAVETASADVGPITFAPGQYDNTANTVTAGPTTNNNQTTGLFRDIFWYSLNNGAPRVGSADYINSGKNLVLVGNSAVDNGTGAFTALNFTGPAVSGGQSYLSIYDTTPADGTATKDTFDATNGLTVSADVLFIKHSSSGGVVALYNEGQNALALLASNADGSNQDVPKVSLVWQTAGTGHTLTSVSLPAASFVASTWYRVTMDLSVTGDSWTVNGTFQDHVNGADPTSALGSTITTLSFTGSLSNPGGGPPNSVLTNPGEVGVMAMANEGISLPDNVGVSVTNFTVVPEPATLAFLLAGGVALTTGVVRRRRLGKEA